MKDLSRVEKKNTRVVKSTKEDKKAFISYQLRKHIDEAFSTEPTSRFKWPLFEIVGKTHYQNKLLFKKKTHDNDLINEINKNYISFNRKREIKNTDEEKIYTMLMQNEPWIDFSSLRELFRYNPKATENTTDALISTQFKKSHVVNILLKMTNYSKQQELYFVGLLLFKLCIQQQCTQVVQVENMTILNLLFEEYNKLFTFLRENILLRN